MTEQQNHLRELLKQAEEIKVEINNLNAQAQAKKDLLLRALGAIEYLQQIGVTLEEQTPVVTPEPTAKPKSKSKGS
jgi:hypothetical protein|tara:strand:- start:66 stop:293 length:228 start_codon:yes stop_codon:yes gene_type:complete